MGKFNMAYITPLFLLSLLRREHLKNVEKINVKCQTSTLQYERIVTYATNYECWLAVDKVTTMKRELFLDYSMV